MGSAIRISGVVIKVEVGEHLELGLTGKMRFQSKTEDPSGNLMQISFSHVAFLIILVKEG